MPDVCPQETELVQNAFLCQSGSQFLASSQELCPRDQAYSSELYQVRHLRLHHANCSQRADLAPSSAGVI